MKEASKLTNNKVVEVVVVLSRELSVWTVSLCLWVKLVPMYVLVCKVDMYVWPLLSVPTNTSDQH